MRRSIAVAAVVTGVVATATLLSLRETTILRLWHQFGLRHRVTFHPATRPDKVIRSESGRPMINVFEQIEFAIPVAHHECECGEVFA